jgi:hypothetical protein
MANSFQNSVILPQLNYIECFSKMSKSQKKCIMITPHIHPSSEEEWTSWLSQMLRTLSPCPYKLNCPFP